MAKIFLVLTIILTGAAAFFGYQTYTKLDTVKTTVEKDKADLAAAKAELTKEQDVVKGAEPKIHAAEDTANTANAAATQAKSDLATASTNLQALQTKYDAQTADLKKAQDDLAAAAAKPSTAPVPGDADRKVADLQAQLQESQALVTTLQGKEKDNEDKITDLTKKADGVALQKARPGLEGEVMAVNPGWSFVVVNIGDRQGATANSVLIVKRGDTMIGKVRISSVEPSTSIADILPDSVGKGESIRPGDRVIFPLQ